MIKKEIIKEAFEYLRSIGKVHTQQDIANKMEISKSNISRAFNGDEKYLTKSFLQRFNDAYDNIFNSDWLLTGEGEKLNAPILTEKDASMNRKGVSERFLETVDKLYDMDKNFIQAANLSKSAFANVRSGKQQASLEMILALCNINKSANSEYILTGRGAPLKENTPDSDVMVVTTEEDYKQAIEQGIKLLPEVNFKFAAGQTELINDPEFVSRYWYLPDCKDCEGVAQIVGNSMAPSYPPGCWVALKRYPFSIERALQIPFGNVFAVVVEDSITGEYFGHVKILRRYKERELVRKYWIAHSINDEEFDDFDIEIAQVRGLWIVKQHVVTDILL